MSKKKKMSAAERIALKLASRKKETASKEGEKTSSSGLVFTSTTEFTQRLKSNMNDRLEERKQKKKVEREAAETTKETKTSTTKTTATTTSSSTKKNVEMTSEPLVQSSMAATLSLLNRTYWCWSVRV